MGDPARRTDYHPTDEAPRDLFRVAGPRRAIDFHGGKLEIQSVEIYDTAVEIRWRVDPDLDIWQAFPLESADLEGDLAEVTDDWAVDELRRKAGEAMGERFNFPTSTTTSVRPTCLAGSVGEHTRARARARRPKDMTSHADFALEMSPS